MIVPQIRLPGERRVGVTSGSYQCRGCEHVHSVRQNNDKLNVKCPMCGRICDPVNTRSMGFPQQTKRVCQ